MKTSITEGMRFRQKVLEYTTKHENNAKAARRYSTNRQQVQRWRKKYDGTANENNTHETAKMIRTLEQDFGFKIKTVQTDNGKEFCNDREQRKSAFEKALEDLKIEYIRTRPYSPWQNGVVERSHKIDNELFYSKKRFKSEKELYKYFQRYSVRTNNISRRILDFKTPNEIVERYFKRAV